MLLENYTVAEKQIALAEKNKPSAELKLKLADLKSLLNSLRQ